ncbi:MAG TPA: hypothetical protein VGX78_15395 [Pirellulales bacterium]|jgi:hypothetical protein|nr:hypothetical protein [Pirellulales bacterium]
MSTNQNQANPQVKLHREPGDDGDDTIVEPNPRVWAKNNAAGAEYLTRKEPYESLIRFKEKPSPEVLDHLKDQGFRWNRDEQVWARPIGYNTAAQDREVGRRAYEAAVTIILEQKGQGREPF